MRKSVFLLVFFILINSSIFISLGFAKSSCDDIGDQYSPDMRNGFVNSNIHRSNAVSTGCDSDMQPNRQFWQICLLLFVLLISIVVYFFVKRRIKAGVVTLFVIVALCFFYFQYYVKHGIEGRLKPVIYLYPTKESLVDVKLLYKGSLTVSYPRYNPKINGWKVKASPNGNIVDPSDQAEYSYIFWEGNDSAMQYDHSKGFVVEGDQADVFLKNILSQMGLIPREYNEFIVYWYPLLKQNKYNLITFAHEEYEKIAPLTISPKPDSVLRVFMVYRALDKKIEIKPQEIKPFKRKGFTVIEWGGTKL